MASVAIKELSASEVVDDGRAASAEDLYMLFGLRFGAVCRVHDAGHAAVGEPQGDADVVVQQRGHTGLLYTDGMGLDRVGTGERARKIHEVAGLANQATATHVRILNPVLAGDVARIDAYVHDAR